MRRGALLKDAQNIGMSPTSVGGGENAPGNCEASAGFCGPGSVKLDGLPKLAALAAAAAVTTVPAAAAASTPRRDTGSMAHLLIRTAIRGGCAHHFRKKARWVYDPACPGRSAVRS